MAIYHALFRYSMLRDARVVADGPYLIIPSGLTTIQST